MTAVDLLRALRRLRHVIADAALAGRLGLCVIRIEPEGKGHVAVATDSQRLVVSRILPGQVDPAYVRTISIVSRPAYAMIARPYADLDGARYFISKAGVPDPFPAWREINGPKNAVTFPVAPRVLAAALTKVLADADAAFDRSRPWWREREAQARAYRAQMRVAYKAAFHASPRIAKKMRVLQPSVRSAKTALLAATDRLWLAEKDEPARDYSVLLTKSAGALTLTPLGTNAPPQVVDVGGRGKRRYSMTVNARFLRLALTDATEKDEALLSMGHRRSPLRVELPGSTELIAAVLAGGDDG